MRYRLAGVGTVAIDGARQLEWQRQQDYLRQRAQNQARIDAQNQERHYLKVGVAGLMGAGVIGLVWWLVKSGREKAQERQELIAKLTPEQRLEFARIETEQAKHRMLTGLGHSALWSLRDR